MKVKEQNQLIKNISYDYKHRLEIFTQLDTLDQATIILQLTKLVKLQLLKKLKDDQLVVILEHLDPDDATDLMQLLSKKRQTIVINQLNEYLKNSISILLRFDPKTAAGVMNINYIQVDVKDKIIDVAQSVRNHEHRTGKLPVILVVREGKLCGQLKGYRLGLANPNELVDANITKVYSIKHNANYNDVIAKFKQHPHNKIVVVGDKKQILGIIYTDDILQLIETAQNSTLYDFAGVSSDESIYDSTTRKLRFRYKWLILNLGTAFLAASMVGIFSETISKHVLLAVYMPIVAGMGGNSATQTLAVMVRGLAQNKVDATTFFRTLKSEIGSGILNGFINGTIIIAIVYFLNRNLMVGAILAIAMVFNLFIAALFGTLVPTVMKKLGKDPASSATVFITTATDVFGFLAFLGLATILLK
jgi:magnesium transporter